MQPLLTQLLNLPGIEVEDYKDLGDQLILEVEAITEEAVCPRCQNVSRHPHQNHRHLVRDLSISGKVVYLKVNRRQFKCRTCEKPFSENLEFVEKRRKQTERFTEFIVQQVLHSDVHNVALQNELKDEEVWSMLEYSSKKKLQVNVDGVRRLGIDEIALRKGQGNYIVVLVDLERKVPLGFVQSRKQEDIKEVLEEWGKEVLNQIEEVSIDMSGNYKSLVQKMMPNAEIIADRFHVMQLVNRDLDQARKELRKVNQKETDEAKKNQIEEAFKQSKYALLKPEENLTEKQKTKLEEVRKVIPSLAKMHQQKEDFRAIFERRQDWHDATYQLLNWLAEAQETFKDSVGTICRWFGQIISYFDNRTTSGIVEGINNKLKLIKRSGYGFRNFDNFQLRCLACWHLSVGSA